MSESKLHIEKGGYVSKSMLLAYLNNELSDDDKLHVEHLINQDPFLQDAIEGLRGANIDMVNATLNSIYKDIDVISGNKKPFTITATIKKYAAAAMLLVFFGLTFLIMQQLNTAQNNNQLAVEKENVSAQQSKAANTMDGMGAGDIQNDSIVEPEIVKNIQGTPRLEEELLSAEEKPVTTSFATEDLEDTKYSKDESITADAVEYNENAAAESIAGNTTVFTDDLSQTVLTSGPVVIGEITTLNKSTNTSTAEKKVLDKSTPASTDDADFYFNVDTTSITLIKPEFPGGLTALNNYLAKSIDYKNTGAVSGTIYVQFIIDDSGKAKSPLITKGINEKVNAEVIRSINRMPKWQPAQSNNTNISVQISMPIYFGSNN